VTPELLTYFFLCFTSVFAIINPFGALMTFIIVAEDMSKKSILKLARKSTFTAFVIMVLFALTGEFIFQLFNISVDGLRVVGGVLFFIMGYDMLQGKAARTKTISLDEQDHIEELAVTPLAIPILCGPGAITVSTVLMQESKNWQHTSLLVTAIAFALFLTFLILIWSNKITNFIGKSGNKVIMRLMGIIMMMVAVEFFFSGVKVYVRMLYKYMLS